jgi:hypothetical protein
MRGNLSALSGGLPPSRLTGTDGPPRGLGLAAPTCNRPAFFIAGLVASGFKVWGTIRPESGQAGLIDRASMLADPTAS